jgi:outer membrane protein OmpA-like peptidoglycan-associated protein
LTLLRLRHFLVVGLATAGTTHTGAAQTAAAQTRPDFAHTTAFEIFTWIFAAIIAGFVVYFCYTMCERNEYGKVDPQSRAINFLVAFLGMSVGWLAGIVLEPFTASEGQRFATYGAALSAFVTGYVAGKADDLVKYGLNPQNLTRRRAFHGALFVVTFVVSLIVVFESRFGINPADLGMGTANAPLGNGVQPPPSRPMPPSRGEIPSGVQLPGGFRIFGAGPNIDLGELAKAITTAAADAGPEYVKKVLEGVGAGVDVAKNTADFASALMGLYRKMFPDAANGPTPLDGGQQGGASPSDDARRGQQGGVSPSDDARRGQQGSVSPFDASQHPTTRCSLTEATVLDRQVNFDFDSAKLPSDAKTPSDAETLNALKSVAARLLQQPISVLIEGHADGVGPSVYNVKLSQERANAVKNFLVDQGVSPPSLLHTYGYGQGYFWQPYAPTDPSNRRVRIVECVIDGLDRCTTPTAPAATH